MTAQLRSRLPSLTRMISNAEAAAASVASRRSSSSGSDPALSYTGTTTETDTRVTTRSKPDRIPDARFFERFHYCQRADRQLGMLQADPDPAAQSAAWRNAARSSWIDTRLLISYCANHASSKTLDIHARRLSVRALAAAGPRPTPHGAGTGLAADALAAD